MFNTKNQTSSQNSQENDSYIHTMKDDLALASNSISLETKKEEETPASPTTSNNLKQNVSASPFFMQQNTEKSSQQPPINKPAQIQKQPQEFAQPAAAPATPQTPPVSQKFSPIQEKPVSVAINPTPKSANPENSFSASAPINRTPAQVQLPTAAPVKKPSAPLASPSPKEKLAPLSPKTNSSWYSVAITAVSVLIVITISLSSYYFFLINPSQKETSEPSDSDISEDLVTVDTSSVETFSSENPNFISLDINSASTQEIQDELQKISKEVVDSKIEQPVEFTITDKNNTPVSFPIFALALKLNLPQSLLENLDDSFSLYIYSDDGVAHSGLSVKTKNIALAQQEMLGQEKTLVADLANIFLSSLPETTSSQSFNESVFNNLLIRYTNLDTSSALSLDYTFNNDYLLIGTSKNTLRNIISKIDSALPKQTESEKNESSESSDVSADITQAVSENTDIQQEETAIPQAENSEPQQTEAAQPTDILDESNSL